MLGGDTKLPAATRKKVKLGLAADDEEDDDMFAVRGGRACGQLSVGRRCCTGNTPLGGPPSICITANLVLP